LKILHSLKAVSYNIDEDPRIIEIYRDEEYEVQHEHEKNEDKNQEIDIKQSL
jgi:hypothetical protein